MPAGASVKLFFYISMFSLLVFFFISYNDIRSNQIRLTEERTLELEVLIERAMKERQTDETTMKEPGKKIQEEKQIQQKLKYILQWTNPKGVPFVYMGVGQQGFLERNCTYTNCFVTGDKNYFQDFSKFDVVAFAGPEVVHYSATKLPDENKRAPHQKFAFASIESADNYPVCTDTLDGFFNWTWTYKLDSDARWGYVVVRNAEKRVIGPNKIMHWMKLEEMDPVSDELKNSISTKSKAAAWFVSNCRSRSNREQFVKVLQKKLEKYSLTVDIYGSCGTMKCPRNNHAECLKLIEKDYYFYLSFENSMSEDYVTEKLLHGLQNNAVPIVLGAANYSRFMPDGIYLNALDLGEEALAERMNHLIQNPEEYYEYFRWKNHYSFHRRVESIETEDYCRFCSMLNEEDLVNTKSVYDNFKQWWTPPGRC